MEKPNAATIGISKMASNGANEPLTDLRNLRADNRIPIPRTAIDRWAITPGANYALISWIKV